MAPTPSSAKQNHNISSVTPSSKSNQSHLRTPQSKQHKLHFNNTAANAEHPVEVIGRIRDHPDRKDKPIPLSTLQINGQSLRVKTDIGYRDFSLDGVSLSEEEDIENFYKKFVASRVNGVKLGAKCTIMMYGPTGSGKSHTMFGCAKQPGIVYRSLKDILGEGSDENGEEKLGVGTFVHVTVLEIYNEELYDLLSNNNGGGFSLGWPKGSSSKVKLEVMGKKAKNATFIAGHEAGKISKEIQKVEKRRIVKSTLCNERSSRSHCMIILDVPTVGGRLMLVDMAGSENIEQAGQNHGWEAKMQTAKINQGNIALKRVVESIANGDSHVPFRDSKLTMLLQDSFEDDKSKILMILCASPDPKELHKTISTLEYGAKAKCIVRGPHTPVKDNGTEDSSSAVTMGSRIAVMDQFIYKLQMENKQREKERNEAQKELTKKEEEISVLRAKLSYEEEMNMKVNERTEKLKSELEKKVLECQKMANEMVEMERRKMEATIFQQKQEVEMLKQRLLEMESELSRSRSDKGSLMENDGISFANRLMEVYSDDSGMVKSMDLDKSMDMDSYKSELNSTSPIMTSDNNNNIINESLSSKRYLSTVYEEEEVEEDDDEKEVEKEIVCYSPAPPLNFTVTPELTSQRDDDNIEEKPLSGGSRQIRIQNIFTLCGNYRELSQNGTGNKFENFESPMVKKVEEDDVSKEVENENENENENLVEVYVKWEASKENPGNVITTLKVGKDSSLAELRKLIEIHVDADNQSFTFLNLGDPCGAPVAREKEGITLTSKLPICNNNGYLACLRPGKSPLMKVPFSSLENLLPVTPMPYMKTSQQGDGFSPVLAGGEVGGGYLSTTPFITRRKN